MKPTKSQQQTIRDFGGMTEDKDYIPKCTEVKAKGSQLTLKKLENIMKKAIFNSFKGNGVTKKRTSKYCTCKGKECITGNIGITVCLTCHKLIKE